MLVVEKIIQNLAGGLFTVMLLLVSVQVWSYPSVQVNTDNINFERLQVEDGLPSSTIYMTIQDRKGYIWFGTEAGLSKFDGYRFTNYTIKDGLPNNNVIDLMEDTKGRIWILSFGALAYYQDNKVHRLDTLPLIGNQWVTGIEEDSQSNLWLTTKEGLFILRNDDTIIQYNTSDWPGKKKQQFYLKLKDTKGDLWVYHDNYFTIIPNKGEKDRHLTLNYPTHKSIRLAELLNEQMIYHSKEGLVLLQDTLQTILPPTIHDMIGTDIGYIMPNKNNHIWVASFSKGIFTFSPQEVLEGKGKVMHYLSEERVSAVLKDHEGTIWFSTLGNGVYYFLPNAHLVHNMTVSSGLSDDNIHSVLVDSKKRLWVGSSDGNVTQLNSENNEITNIFKLSNPDKAYARVLDMYEIGEDTIGFATDDGLTIYENGNLKKFNKSLAFKTISGVQGKDVWIGASGYVLKVPQDSLLNKTKTVRDLLRYKIHKERTYAIAPDSNGNAWLGNTKGLKQLTATNELVDWRKKNDLFKVGISAIKKDKTGLLWMATHGNGVLIKRGDSIKNINTERGLVSNICNHLHIAEDSTIWLATNRGVTKIYDYDFDKHTFRLQHYDSNDGLISNEVNAVATLGSKVIAGTTRGLSIFDAKKMTSDSSPPHVYITNLSLGGQDTTITEKEFEVSYTENSIKVDFIGLSYTNRGQLEYRYKLEGIDKSEHKTYATSAHYPSLPFGTYTFYVYAVNKAGQISPRKAKFTLTIHSPFWYRWWFISGVIIVVFFIVFISYKHRVTEIARRNLAQQVAEKTVAIRKNLEKLKHSNEQLEQFAYIASHDLKEPLRSIASYVQLLEYRYKNQLDDNAKEYIGFAVAGVKRLQSLIDGLLLYSRLTSDPVPYEEVNLNNLVDTITKNLGTLITDRQATVVCDPLPSVVAIPFHMNQLFQNLIHNAIKFNQSEQPFVRIKCEETDNSWLFSVSDNGIGMEQNFIHKVFIIFQRLNKRDRYDGTGIGLSICKRIVKEHGGRIWATSQPNVGSTFYFTLKKHRVDKPLPRKKSYLQPELNMA